MSQPTAVALWEHFSDLLDPRIERSRVHHLFDILVLTICAVVGGADNWAEVERYGRRKHDWLKTFLTLPNGIPSHDTLGRVFARLDPAGFQRCFLSWVGAVAEASDGRLIAIDGKTLRHSFDTAAGRGALHLVSAWATENHLVLGQQAVDTKSNEITAIPELLRILDLTGAIVTIDAMGCQKEIAAQIHQAGGDYVLALKENHEKLYQEVAQLFVDGLEEDFAAHDHRSHHTRDTNHGRTEERHYHILRVPEPLQAKHPEWEGLRSLGMVWSERQVGQDEVTCETRFFLSSLPPTVKRFARAVRGHWGIENRQSDDPSSVALCATGGVCYHLAGGPSGVGRMVRPTPRPRRRLMPIDEPILAPPRP